MSTLITRYVRAAAKAYLADPTSGFNATLASIAATHGVTAFTIDWSATSKQFWEAYLTPDDVDESAASKYPMAFLHGVASDNSHDSLPRTFSGSVDLALAFWFTDRATSAPRTLEPLCDAVEDAVNAMFADGNWPQLWGASNAVMVRCPSQRARLDTGGEHWRASIVFRLTFQVDN